jgi:inosine/xanthosine triphosphatase
MKIIVGSTNKPKLEAVRSVFKNAFPETAITVEGIKADSGVRAHPISGEEALRGAINRATHALELQQQATYSVGIEGGLLRLEDRAWEIGWVAIKHTKGELATGLSAGVELQGELLQAILDGQELNEVIEMKFGSKLIGDRNGFYGMATNDLATRQAAYEQGIVFALARFLHPEFYVRRHRS